LVCMQGGPSPFLCGCLTAVGPAKDALRNPARPPDCAILGGRSMAKADGTILDAAGARTSALNERRSRESSRRPSATAEVTKLQNRRVLPGRRGRASCARRWGPPGRRRLERWPKGVHPGIRPVDGASGGRRRRLLPEKRVPKGAPDYVQNRRGIEFPSGRHARRDFARPRSPSSAGARKDGDDHLPPLAPVRSADVDHPDELRLDPRPAAGHRLRGRGCASLPRARDAAEGHRLRRLSRRRAAAAASTSTSVSSRSGPSPTSAHAAIAFGRELERRMPGEGHHEVGGRRRRGERVLRPTTNQKRRANRPRSASAYSIRPKPGATRLGAARLGRAAAREARGLQRSRRCPRPLRGTWATSTRRSTTWPTSLQPLLDMYERDEAEGEGRHALPAPTTRRCRGEAESASSRRATAIDPRNERGRPFAAPRSPVSSGPPGPLIRRQVPRWSARWKVRSPLNPTRYSSMAWRGRKLGGEPDSGTFTYRVTATAAERLVGAARELCSVRGQVDPRKFSETVEGQPR